MKRNGIKPILGVVLFIFGLWFGDLIVKSSWGGLVFLSVTRDNQDRTPAAIPKKIDFYHLSEAAFKARSKQRLIEEIKFSRSNGGLGFQFGNFAFKNKSGARQLACDSFDRIEFKLVAQGVATSGEHPTIIVDGICKYEGEDVNLMAPIWLPIEKILKSPTHISELTENNDTRIKFENVWGGWPNKWSLVSIRLYSEENTLENEIEINQNEIFELLNSIVTIDFDQNTRNVAGSSEKESRD